MMFCCECCAVNALSYFLVYNFVKTCIHIIISSFFIWIDDYLHISEWIYVHMYIAMCVDEYTIYLHATSKIKKNKKKQKQKQKLQSYFVYMSANCLRYLHILLPVFGICRSRWLWWRWWSWQERNCIYRTGKKCTIYYTLCKIFDAIIRIQIFYFIFYFFFFFFLLL